MPKPKVHSGTLTAGEVIVDKNPNEVYDIGFYGSVEQDVNHLSFVEAIHLMDRKRLTVKDGKKKVSRNALYDLACEFDKEFPQKYIAYKDLRERGYLVRTGFKFGTHFRVYEKGVSLKRGPKEAKEHTKWIVHAVPEGYTCSYSELSRAVRLAHNIRAKMLWAIVDEEKSVTYYQIVRETP